MGACQRLREGATAGELRVRARWASRQRTAAPVVKGLVEAPLNGLRDLVGDGPHGTVGRV